MSQTSYISRYRPAVLAITGVAAACGIYVLYTVYADGPNKGALHRSNAIHRPRGDSHRRPIIDWIQPSEDAPLGTLRVRMGHRGMQQPITLGVIATGDLSRLFGIPIDPVFQEDLNVAAVQCLLEACFNAREQDQQEPFQQMRLGGLAGGLISRNMEMIQIFKHRILTVLPSVSMEQIDLAITKFTNSAAFRTPNESSSDGEDATYADTEDVDGLDASDTEPSQGLKGLLYHIAETDAKRKAYEHHGIHCEECSERPIRGVRWTCLNCPDFDLCSTCEANTTHIKTHVFAKIKIPLPVLSQPTKNYPIWYPGDPRRIHPHLPPALKKRLQEQYDFEGPQIDANYDQFTCISNVPWADDPNKIKGAIDRRAFNEALTSERWPVRFKPNAIYDRMFSFYDANNDGLIGFEEFLSGIAYLRGPKRYTPLRRAIEGFDIDADGYVDRKDFIRLFRAKHEIQKLIINDMVEGNENELTQSAMPTLRSSQPISSVFNMEEIPRGENRPRTNKLLDQYGDAEPMPGADTIIDDNKGWSGEANGRLRRPIRPQERLQQHLSRFGDTLDGPPNEVDGVRDNHGTSQGNGIDEYSRRTNGQDVPSSSRDEFNIGFGTDFDQDDDPPLNQDILWQVVEDGFHEMLDPLFKAKEREHEEVVNTREERRKWRKEIDEVTRKRKHKQALQEELSNGAAMDPLMATAMSSFDRVSIPRTRPNGINGTSGPATSGNMVSTDTESLARHEADIAQRPLEELLDATGYSVNSDGFVHDDSEARSDGFADVNSNGTVNEQQALNPSPEEQQSFSSRDPNHSIVSPSDLSQDPTMPQNRPNTPSQIRSAGQTPTAIEGWKAFAAQELEESKPPSRDRLEHLSLLDEREREIENRGGPGRLSFNEVEDLVKADSSRELRGLVISWLDWASF